MAAVSLMTGEPGGFHDNYSFEAEDHPGQNLMFNTQFADFEYVKTLGLKIIAGRDFSSAFITDSTNSVLINRAAAVLLRLYADNRQLGKWINITGVKERRTIVGVVEDYHFTSLKTTIAPLVISTQKRRPAAGVDQIKNRQFSRNHRPHQKRSMPALRPIFLLHTISSTNGLISLYKAEIKAGDFIKCVFDHCYRYSLFRLVWAGILYCHQKDQRNRR